MSLEDGVHKFTTQVHLRDGRVWIKLIDADGNIRLRLEATAFDLICAKSTMPSGIKLELNL